jgi:hypothetical protein
MSCDHENCKTVKNCQEPGSGSFYSLALAPVGLPSHKNNYKNILLKKDMQEYCNRGKKSLVVTNNHAALAIRSRDTKGQFRLCPSREEKHHFSRPNYVKRRSLWAEKNILK